MDTAAPEVARTLTKGTVIDNKYSIVRVLGEGARSGSRSCPGRQGNSVRGMSRRASWAMERYRHWLILMLRALR